MDDALAKIRPHTTSNLINQKTPANLLVALESTFEEQNTEATPTAYLAALLTTLEETLQRKETSLKEGDILPAELYLLALVAPFVPAPVIRSNLSTILSLTTPLFPALNQHAPPLKSQLSLYQALLLALDKSQLDVQGIRQAFASILMLCIDGRPKVRKRASEVVKDVLASPPSPLTRHPYANRVAEWIQSALKDVGQSPLARKGSQTNGTDTGIHILSFLRIILPHLPSSALPDITSLILELPRLGNPFLSQSAYSTLSALLSVGDEDEDGDTMLVTDHSQIHGVVEAVLDSPPSKGDNALAPAWVEAVGAAMNAYKRVDIFSCATEFGKAWRAVWPFLTSTDASTRRAAAHSLDQLCGCITNPLLKAAQRGKTNKSPVSGIIGELSEAFDSIVFAQSMSELLSVISSLIRATKGFDTDAAKDLLLPLVKSVGDLRTQKGFEYKEAADEVLSTAIGTFGPHVVLDILPLNLEPADRTAGNEPRAYILPLLAQPHPSPLSHFVQYFVPLSERMFEYQQKADMEGRQTEAKVWNVLIDQIWSGFSGYCSSSPNLRTALSQQFSQLLSQLLYGQPELRTAVLRGLKVMVESNVKPIDRSKLTYVLSAEDTRDNIEFLRTQAGSWLAVFFNVFSSITPDSRNLVGDTISVWASVAQDTEIQAAYVKVIGLLKTNLPKKQVGGNITVAVTTLDLLQILLPYFSSVDSSSLFASCLTADVLNAKDNGIQKRGYKILTKLVEQKKLASLDAEAVLRQLDALADGLAPAAKKDRFTFLSCIIPSIPETSLHLLVMLIPEAVLGTKEPSDKARSAAFDLILSMGKRMKEGGIVRRSMIDGMDEDGATDSAATVQEFITMIAGGLAGASPHMISATVTALSRLVFEFKDELSPDMQEQLLTTLLVFLTSANREIVKSVLGFIKLAIHTLPVDLIRPHLPELVPALLRWSHDHKNHFKVKVRHIFERLLRRFGYEDVYKCAGNEDAVKVLTNIKKRKDRAKRKRVGKEDDEDAPAAKAATGDAFEDVLYGSESELGDSDEDDEAPSPETQKKKKKGGDGPRLQTGGDEPIDLLKGASSHIKNAPASRRRKPGQDATRFKTDEESGKMVIDDGDSDSDNERTAATAIEGTAYREGLISTDGFTRGADGRVKFNKDTKKRRRENTDLDEDVEMVDAGTEGKPAPRKQQKSKDPKLGHEFKAKRAGGDVKKGGVDPYAYVSISQAAKKGSKGKRLGVAGKR